jgi:hypothetical protein
MVGAIADQLLSANARAHVQQSLGLSLRAASTWADCVKDVVADADQTLRYEPDARFHATCSPFQSARGIEHMVDFARRNWRNCADVSNLRACHSTYHFTDVDVHHRSYDRAFAGTSDHDVVSALVAAIAVLRGRPATPPIDIEGRTEALLLVSHLVGDLHQPLHVGAISLDPNGLPVIPREPGKRDAATDTRGGNRIEDGQTNLHGEWDEIPATLRPSRVPSSMILAARAVPLTRGSVESWPAAWAGDTLGEAAQAFSAMSFTHSGANGEREWDVHFADRASYIKMKDRIQIRQITLAGARLAQLLNAIWP